MPTSNRDAVLVAVADAAVVADADVFAYAVDIDSGEDIGVSSDAAVVTGSVFKVPVLVEYVLQVEAGELLPDRRLAIRAGEVTVGPTGLSVFSDDAEWSLRDVATSMITVSDNAATDVVAALVGIDRVNATMARFGLTETVLTGDCASLFATIATDVAAAGYVDVEQLTRAEPDRVPRFTACTPHLTNRTTPREAASLLRMLWLDTAAGPDACAEARRILGLQVWSHRLSTGFPDDDVQISGKTGTLLGVVRNEIGVVEFPDSRRYAVAVFVRTHRVQYRQPTADTLIGTVGRLLVDHLASG